MVVLIGGVVCPCALLQINDLVKRARHVKVHAMIVGHLKAKLPWMGECGCARARALSPRRTRCDIVPRCIRVGWAVGEPSRTAYGWQLAKDVFV